MSRSGVAGSYDSSIFSFLRNHHTGFHSGYTNLHSHKQCNRVSFFPVMDFLTGDKWYLIMDLICIYLIIIKSNVEHLFMCLLDIGMSSSKKSLFSKGLLLPIFWLNFFFFILSYISCFCVLESNLLLATLFAHIFSHSISCIFILFMVFLAVQKALSAIRSHLFIFAFVSITLGDRLKYIYTAVICVKESFAYVYL